MERMLTTHNRHWEESYKIKYQRKYTAELLNSLTKKHITVLRGIRRSGKSTLMKIMINHLIASVSPREILYLNLDDPFFMPVSKDPEKLYDVITIAEKLTQQKIKYLFLDEVQAVDGWEKFVKTAYDTDAFNKIVLTGSNSMLLGSGLAKLLSGRYIDTQIYPLGFSEILKINGIESRMDIIKKLPEVLRITDGMLKYGSFPEVYDAEEDDKRSILSAYYETILLKDCVSLGEIRDYKSFKELSYYLLANMTSLYSYLSLSKALGIHDKSVKEYIGHMENSYLAYELKQFAFSLKEQANSKKKLYYADNGFYRLAFDFSPNKGRLFENLAATELIKCGYELFHFNTDTECDFIARKDGQLLAFQVCYELNDSNRGRELKSLSALPFGVGGKYIITYNQTDTAEDVSILPFWDFFGCAV
ncbi:ATP-binding protein [Seleniivibrio woodruffii]|uniref:ATP-binding protein n=1 Tax=Seleniivibrio woodruffii TaxID=1078050 RepID=UPI002409E4A6|nr:ATP-binding protein [Seleniivibrio woodruffii]